MEGACSSKTRIPFYQTAWRHIPGDSTLQAHCMLDRWCSDGRGYIKRLLRQIANRAPLLPTTATVHYIKNKLL
jgi:hypothetical protein